MGVLYWVRQTLVMPLLHTSLLPKLDWLVGWTGWFLKIGCQEYSFQEEIWQC